jgi:hypothetical protein
MLYRWYEFTLFIPGRESTYTEYTHAILTG